MTPLIFHAIDFSAREVGSGLAVSALIGTVVRLLSGALLDRGICCSWPVRGTTLLAIAADLILLQADNYNSYLLGQLLLGCAAGLYWPAIELAVPLSCGNLSSGRGYALVRSADALGIGIGTRHRQRHQQCHHARREGRWVHVSEAAGDFLWGEWNTYPSSASAPASVLAPSAFSSFFETSRAFSFVHRGSAAANTSIARARLQSERLRLVTLAYKCLVERRMR